MIGDRVSAAFGWVNSASSAIIAKVPTPLEERLDIGADLGLRCFLKREDLIDDLGGGHKVRKLAFVAADAMRHHADILITGGSLPSAQCVAVAAAAIRLGVRAQLIYAGDEQERPLLPQGNYLLSLLLGAEIIWHERTAWSRMEELLAAQATKEAGFGSAPFVIRPGLTEWPGLLGSVDLGLELAEQLSRTGVDPSTVKIVAAAGTGTTCVGISVAAELLGLPWRVHGVCVGNSESTKAQVGVGQDVALRFLPNLKAMPSNLFLHSDPLGTVYDRPREDEMEAMSRALRRYQLIFDQNYMVKVIMAAAGLVNTGEIGKDDVLVVIHSGGALGLFGTSPANGEWYAQSFAEYLRRPAKRSSDGAGA